MAELDDETYEQILRLTAEGDRLVEARQYRDAVNKFGEAWALVPEPQSEWNAATWILTAVADAAFLGGFYQTARESLDYVMYCPDASGNPFIHLRRGQVLFEQNELDGAADELMRAYMGAGPEIFENDDGKYLSFLRTRATIP